MKQLLQQTTLLLPVFTLLLLAACSQDPEDGLAGTEDVGQAIGTVTEVPDFAAIKDVKAKKKAFFDFMRPIVLSENAKVAKSRERLLAIAAQLKQNKTLSGNDTKWLAFIANKYRVDMPTIKDEKAWELLKLRIDTVPFRLALAQSANESSWGTSRFVKQGRNFFGEWCFSPGCGIVPLKRSKGLTHEVSSFETVNESVASYLRNINRVDMYKPLRLVRQEMREEGKKPTAHKLAAGLIGYSERREAYVDEIRSMIKHNFDLMAGPPQ